MLGQLGQPALLARMRWTRLVLLGNWAKDRVRGIGSRMEMVEMEFHFELDGWEWRSIALVN